MLNSGQLLPIELLTQLGEYIEDLRESQPLLAATWDEIVSSTGNINDEITDIENTLTEKGF